MRRSAVLVWLAASALGCGAGADGSDAPACDPAQLACEVGCVDPMTDHDHCGRCDVACAAEQECRGGACEVPCRLSLTAPVLDAWGYEWDGAPRTAATVDEAAATCAAFGGRLPSVTELYRVRTGAHGIATVADAAPLWSATPAARTDQMTVALADGALGQVAAATPTAYRCVCSPAAPTAFAGPRCNGPPGAECYALGELAVDNQDRPPLRKGAAIWECAAERAHLAEPETLVQAIEKGLLGSGTPLHTADQARYDLSTTLAWTTATWAAAGHVSYLDAATPAPFRCAGWSFATGTYPGTIAGEFVGAAGGYKGEAADSAVGTWADIHAACTARGGHLARSAELAELIMAGLPAGAGAPVFTADQVGYNGTDFLAATITWTGEDRRLPYDYAASGTTSWDYKVTSHPYRCIYYPLAAGYVAPTTCAGGCFTVTLPGATPAIMWFDSTSRSAAAYAGAVDACRREGGHLASERDLTEAIRAGLPNGGGDWTLTADFAIGNVDVVRWTGADPAFSDLYPTYMTWADLATPYAFRCMWTNELR